VTPLRVAAAAVAESHTRAVSTRRARLRLLRLLHGQEELELRWELLLGVEAVRKVNPSDAAVGVDLHAQRLNVICAVRAAGEVGKVELDLVPTFVQAHGHRADERLYTRCALRGEAPLGGSSERWDGGILQYAAARTHLVVRRAESPANVLVVQHLHLECEVLL
jgi:hypothetical protein